MTPSILEYECLAKGFFAYCTPEYICNNAYLRSVRQSPLQYVVDQIQTDAVKTVGCTRHRVQANLILPGAHPKAVEALGICDTLLLFGCATASTARVTGVLQLHQAARISRGSLLPSTLLLQAVAGAWRKRLSHNCALGGGARITPRSCTGQADQPNLLNRFVIILYRRSACRPQHSCS